MDFTENNPIYLQIADIFCESILSGKWKENERIPSIRELAIELEVNPNTAIRAFALMETEGVIYNKRGIGFFVANGGFEKAKDLMKKEFIAKQLPQLKKTLSLLSISTNELIDLLKK